MWTTGKKLRLGEGVCVWLEGSPEGSSLKPVHEYWTGEGGELGGEGEGVEV